MKLLRKIITESIEANGVSPEKFKKDLKTGDTDYSDVHEHGIKNLTGDISHIGSKEKDAIKNWTTPVYRSIQNHLRTGNGDTKARELSQHLSNAVEGHSIPNETWAYRGLHGPHAEHLKTMKKGDVFHSKGMSSTTLDPKRATHFAKGEDILAMHLPAGSKALYVSHPKLNSWEAEKELTLPHNTHFKYHGSSTVEAPEHHYDGTPTGAKKKYTLHHVEAIPHIGKSIQIDR